MRQDRPGDYLELAHRIDAETSGCLVLAKTGQALRRLADQFRDGPVDKRYLGLMQGRLPEDRMVVDVPLASRMEEGEDAGSERSALTVFRRLQDLPGACYVEAELHTGRTHQIRQHALHLGLPLAGDSRYSQREAVKTWKKRGLKRLFLHAHSLSFRSIDGNRVEAHAPLPDDLRQLLDKLETRQSSLQASRATRSR